MYLVKSFCILFVNDCWIWNQFYNIQYYRVTVWVKGYWACCVGIWFSPSPAMCPAMCLCLHPYSLAIEMGTTIYDRRKGALLSPMTYFAPLQCLIYYVHMAVWTFQLNLDFSLYYGRRLGRHYQEACKKKKKTIMGCTDCTSSPEVWFRLSGSCEQFKSRDMRRRWGSVWQNSFTVQVQHIYRTVIIVQPSGGT